eukprot:Skav214017  [mRNA]  locus=scaffold1070:448956:453091:+ [translate_table: standard]
MLPLLPGIKGAVKSLKLQLLKGFHHMGRKASAEVGVLLPAYQNPLQLATAKDSRSEETAGLHLKSLGPVIKAPKQTRLCQLALNGFLRSASLTPLKTTSG